jgi:eukaryotic-like serine/threonine-protein kinase
MSPDPDEGSTALHESLDAATETVTPPGTDATVPVSVGPYRLLQLLGAGGMGEVWLGEQTVPVRRRVAVKIIKTGMDTKEVVARFESERQALALMDHPVIAKVLDAGSTPEGRPYFVMEYVPGVSITEHCDRHKLSTQERLALFLQVCEGVQHAHQKAVIHRDLKPSNILVSLLDGRAQPKIIDFGIAKAIAHRLTDKTLFTEAGSLLGTPEYMSPEQAEPWGQDVDTRTDVYSLGVILYQLLTGELPLGSKELRSSSDEELRRKLREVEPLKPSARLTTLGANAGEMARARQTDPGTLRRELHGDLDAITMKALAKERSRRYGTPSELATDVGRHLRNEPVVARPPSRAYRVQKYIQRHRVGVVIVSGLLVLLTGFAISMAVQARRTARERDRANREAEASKRVVAFMTGMFRGSDPSEARGNTITAREVLDRASKDIETGLGKDPEVRARLLGTMGEVYLNLGLLAQAEPLLRNALETQLHVLGPASQETLESRNRWAELLYRQAHYQQAEEFNRETLEMARRTLGPDHEVTITSLDQLASTLLDQGRFKDSEQIYRELLVTDRRLDGPDGARTLATLNNLANALSRQRRFAEAAPLRTAALEGSQRTLGSDHPRTLMMMSNLAADEYGLGNYAAAEKLHLQLIDVQRRVLGPEHTDTLMQLENLANAYTGEHRFDEAEKLLRDVLAVERRARGSRTLLAHETLYNLACNASAAGQRERALGYLREAVDNGMPLAIAQHMGQDPDLKPLRGDPEFEALAARAKQAAGSK